MNLKAPIVSLHFNRPEHSRQSLLSLSQNDGAEDSELFIFCDGARNEQEKIKVQQVHEVVRSQQWCGKVHIIKREKNLGCFHNVISAVTEVCNQYGRVIVHEDDLILAPYFLDYMNHALEQYQNNEYVMHITAYLWPIQAELTEAFFLKVPNIWGWATWQRAWEKYHTDAALLLDIIRSKKLEQEFSFQGGRPYISLLEAAANGSKNSWSIYWTAVVFLNGLSLYPQCSLVRNIGFDGTGSNYTSSTSIYDTTLFQEQITVSTGLIAENTIVKQKFIEYFQSIQPRRGTLWERGVHKLKKMVRSLVQ